MALGTARTDATLCMITGNFSGCGGSAVEGSNAAAFCPGAFSRPLGNLEALAEGLFGKAGLKAERLWEGYAKKRLQWKLFRSA